MCLQELPCACCVGLVCRFHQYQLLIPQTAWQGSARAGHRLGIGRRSLSRLRSAASTPAGPHPGPRAGRCRFHCPPSADESTSSHVWLKHDFSLRRSKRHRKPPGPPGNPRTPQATIKLPMAGKTTLGLSRRLYLVLPFHCDAASAPHTFWPFYAPSLQWEMGRAFPSNRQALSTRCRFPFPCL